jgi:hypothetical protein
MRAVLSITFSETTNFVISRIQTSHLENFGDALKLLIILNSVAVISTETMASGDAYVSATASDSHLEG